VRCRSGPCSLAFVLTGLVATASCVSDDPQDVDAEQEEFAGLNRADVREILARDDSAWDSSQERTERIRGVARGWATCRAVYEIYDEWVRTGSLGPEPEPAQSDVEVADSIIEIDRAWIKTLYGPLAAGDRALAHEQLVSDQGCGFVPANAEGDRSMSIAEALAER